MTARLARTALGLALLLAACGPENIDAPPSEPTPAAIATPAAMPTPDVPLLLRHDGLRAPSIAAGPDGAAYAVWADASSETAGVMLQRLASGQPEGQPVRVDSEGDAATHPQTSPRVAVGPDGGVVVVWAMEYDAPTLSFPATRLFAARSDDGGHTFSAPALIPEALDYPTEFGFHDLAFGPDGALYISWLDGRSRDEPHHSGAQPGVHPREASPFVMASHGTPMHAAGMEIRIAKSTDGGRTFAPSVRLARDTCECCRTAVTVAPDGTVYVAWRHIFRRSQRDIALARSTDGGAQFSFFERVHEDGWALDGCPHAGPSLAADESGTLHVVWYTGAPDSRGVHHIRSNDGGRTFDERSTLLLGGAPIAQVAAASAPDGGVWLAWEDAGAVQIAHASGDSIATASRIAEATAPYFSARDGRALLGFTRGDAAGLAEVGAQ